MLHIPEAARVAAIESATLPLPERERPIPAELGQIVLVLQGGGALGAYQAGVYQALHEAGIEPDWVIGTSIGAINASLIAGNAPGERLAGCSEFWRRMQHGAWSQTRRRARRFGAAACRPGRPSRSGIAGFFGPNPWAFLGLHMPARRRRGRLLLAPRRSSGR